MPDICTAITWCFWSGCISTILHATQQHHDSASTTFR